MTTRALKSSALVVKGANVPAKAKPPSYEAFDDVIARGEGIRRTIEFYEKSVYRLGCIVSVIEEEDTAVEIYVDEINDQHQPLDPGDLADFVDDIRGFRASLDYYVRDEVCDRNHRGRVRRSVISEQVAVLIGSVPSAQPHNPKMYAAMMIEDINAARVGPIALEMACRKIRREGSNFAPSIPEMLKALKAQRERLDPIVRAANVDAEKLNATLTRLNGKAKRALKIARQKRIEREERYLAECAAWRAKLEAERQQAEQARKEAEERARAKREAKAAEDAEWDRKWRAARVFNDQYPEAWEAAVADLSPKMAGQDAATLAAMHEAGGLFIYLAQLVRTRLANGAMPRADDAMGR